MGRVTAKREDRTLVERVLERGDERAFRELYRRHTPYLYQFALRVLGGHEQEAEDVIQETWIRAVEGLAGFRWEAGLRTWLGGITLNQCRSRFRRRERMWMEAVPVAETMAAPLPAPVERVDTAPYSCCTTSKATGTRTSPARWARARARRRASCTGRAVP
jgi:DNA-directed RNA polymerase specialized sigma24 family protein